MKIKILGILGFIGAVYWLLFSFVMLYHDWLTISGEELAAISLIIIATLFNIVYILLTRFSNINLDEIKKVSIENRLLKIKIEQKKLQDELAAAIQKDTQH